MRIDPTQQAQGVGGGQGVELPRPFFKADSGKTAHLAPGTVFRIVLPENAGSTGYAWTLQPKGANPVFDLLNSSYVPGSTAIGGGGSRVMTFKIKEHLPRNMVNIDLKLVNKRSWESQIADSFTLKIRP